MPGNKKRSPAQKKANLIKRAQRMYAHEQKAILSKPMQEAQMLDICIGAHTSLDAMLNGFSEEEHWHNLALSLNYALVLCEMDVCGSGQYIDIPQRARRALVEAQQRGIKTGRWGLSGVGIQDMRLVLELHDQQLQLATHGQVIEAQQVIKARKEAGDFYTIQNEAIAA